MTKMNDKLTMNETFKYLNDKTTLFSWRHIFLEQIIPFQKMSTLD